MKPINKILLSLTLIVGLSSCTEFIRMNYNEIKSLPIKSEINGVSKIEYGTIDVSTLDKLFDIPSDSKVTKFTITGISIQVNPTAGTEADFIEYAILFSNTNNSETKVSILAQSKHQFIATGDAFSISSEFNPDSLALLKCMLGNFLLYEKNNQCITTSEIKYSLGYRATDAFGNPKIFKGSITGTFNFQIVYETCEEVPETLFSEFDKCQ